MKSIKSVMFAAGILASSSQTVFASVISSTSLNAFNRDDISSENFIVSQGDPNLSPPIVDGTFNARSGTGILQWTTNFGRNAFCSGSMISATHFLTAAHCIEDVALGNAQNPFVSVGGLESIGGEAIDVIDFAIHPLWFDPIVGFPAEGSFGAGDIAVLQLERAINPSRETYNIYRGNDEFNRETEFYGYGRSGQGDTGATQFDLQGRAGVNMFEATLHDLFAALGVPDFLPGSVDTQLLSDFDNGLEANNAMPWWLGEDRCLEFHRLGFCVRIVKEPTPGSEFPDLGFGANEVSISNGDSGGPAFIIENGDLFIAGVASFGFSYCDPSYIDLPDVTCSIDSSFGELAGHTRVSSYADWIDLQVRTLVVDTPAPVSAPTSILFFAVSIGLIGGLRRRKN